MARCAFSVNLAAFNSMMRSIRSLTAFSFRFAGNFLVSSTLVYSRVSGNPRQNRLPKREIGILLTE